MADEAPNRLKENAGTITAMFIVASFIFSGFMPPIIDVLLHTKVEMPLDWSAAMLPMAATALGYLVGRRLSSGATYTQDQFDAALATPPPAKAEPKDAAS